MASDRAESGAGEPTFDQELLPWLGDERLAVRAADAGRIRGIAAEFALGCHRLAKIGPAVPPSARVAPRKTHPHYGLIRRIGAELGRAATRLSPVADLA